MAFCSSINWCSGIISKAARLQNSYNVNVAQHAKLPLGVEGRMGTSEGAPWIDLSVTKPRRTAIDCRPLLPL